MSEYAKLTVLLAMLSQNELQVILVHYLYELCADLDIILIVENKTYYAVDSPPILRNTLIK